MRLSGLSRGPALLGLLLLLLLPPLPVSASGAGKLQAAMVYRLASFVEWPDGSLREGMFRVGVVDAPDVAAELEKLSETRKLAGRTFEVKRLKRPDAGGGFDLLFVGAKANRRVDALLAQRAPNVLTMSNASGFAKRGGMIQLVTVGGRKVKFEINRATSEKAGLRISSRLLELAAKVHSAGGGR